MSGEEAVRICETYPGKIHLLLADMVIPDIPGPVIAEQVRGLRPKTGIVYMTGYTDDVLQRSLAEQSGVLLEKPFTPTVLTQVLRQVLDEEHP